MMPIVDRPVFDIQAGMFAGKSAASAEMLVLLAGAEGITLSTCEGDGNNNGNGKGGAMQYHVFAPGWSGLVVLDRISCKVHSGHGAAYAVETAALSKLQAFMDAARVAPAVAVGDGCPGMNNGADAIVNNAPLLVATGFPAALDARDWSAIERWFLAQSVRLDDASDFACIGAVLRATEQYKLVRFLLTQPASRSLHDLSIDYGLSYSHFRRLCREALGRGGKAEFQYWRNVRALLDMVDGGGSLTDVALRQGFSSSSHFSDAMKGQFGISPRYLRRAIDLEQ